MKNLLEIIKDIRDFKEEYRKIISETDSSVDRVRSLEKTLEKTSKLNIKQRDMFIESVRLVEHGFYKAAIIIGWAAFIDYLYDLAINKYLSNIKKHYKNLQNIKTREELQEKITDHFLIEIMKKVGAINKNTMKSIHGLLAKRNECAHPSDYNPSMNQAIGYIDELIERINLTN